MYWTQNAGGALACRNTRQINGLSYGIQAADSPGLDEATLIARIIADGGEP